jgi:hypothetical protein
MLKPKPRRILQAFREPKWIRAWAHRAAGKLIYTLYSKVAFPVVWRLQPGVNIYDSDWDLLIVLDACRVDALREVADEYDFINDVESHCSVATMTAEWMLRTFHKGYEDEIKATTYVTANPWIKRTLDSGGSSTEQAKIPDSSLKFEPVDSSTFHHIERLWDYDGEAGHPDGGVPPEYVTDRSVNLGRSQDVNRFIVHYMQPHAPYTQRAEEKDRSLNQTEKRLRTSLALGANRNELWEKYLLELRSVLDSVEVLLKNFDAESVVITADHGEGFGEWFGYEHPPASPHPQIRYVPWVETTAKDTGECEPSFEQTNGRQDIESHLRDLGYVQS